MKSKRISILILVLMFNIGSHIFGSVPKYVAFNNEVRVNKEITLEDVHSVAAKYVPKELFDSFCYYTTLDDENETKYFAVQILSIGFWESGWKITKSAVNKDDSYDIGYLMLNSKNIASERFMSYYGPKDFIANKNNELEVYLITCINFYKSLYKRYGSDAVYAYNGGESRYLRKSLPNSTYIYKQRVKEYMDRITNECAKASKDRMHKEKILENISKNVFKIVINDKMNVLLFYKLHCCIEKPNKNSFLQFVYIFVNREDEVYENLDVYNKPNDDYVFVGETARGLQIRPLFYCRSTGRTYIC